MVSPRHFKNESYAIREIFDETEIKLMRSIARELDKGKSLDVNDWRIQKLVAITDIDAKEREFIQKTASNLNLEIQDVLENAYKKGIHQADIDAKELKELGSIQEEVKSGADFFAINKGQLNVITRQTQIEGSATLLNMYGDTLRTYRSSVELASGLVATGGHTLNEAIKIVKDDLVKTGIGNVTYANGRNVSAGAWAEMATRTASLRSALNANSERMKEYGYNLVLVSQHIDSSDLCQPWQGKVYFDDSGAGFNNTKYPSLSTAIDGGLYHPNCRHFQTPFDPEVATEPKLVEVDEELYQKEQKQRYIERNIRNWKQRDAVATGKEKIKTEAKVKEWQKRNLELVKSDSRLRRDYTREQLAWDGNMQLKAAPKTNLKAIEKPKIKTLSKPVDRYENINEAFESVKLSKKIPEEIRTESEKIFLKLSNEYNIDTKSISIATTTSKNAAGYYQYGGMLNKKTKTIEMRKKLALSSNSFRSKEALQNSINFKIERNGRKIKDIYSTVYHEFAHTVDVEYMLKKDVELNDFIKIFDGQPVNSETVSAVNRFNRGMQLTRHKLSNEIEDEMMKELGLNRLEFKTRVVEELGKYAGTSRMEFLAEGFASYKTIPLEEQSEFLKLFADKFETKVKEVF